MLIVNTMIWTTFNSGGGGKRKCVILASASNSFDQGCSYQVSNNCFFLTGLLRWLALSGKRNNWLCMSLHGIARHYNDSPVYNNKMIIILHNTLTCHVSLSWISSHQGWPHSEFRFSNTMYTTGIDIWNGQSFDRSYYYIILQRLANKLHLQLSHTLN